ncbi:MAG: ABC transporter substrate-binding protein [Desulfarculaceae bacterium]|jgi:peptide/nickel transport system substrate-binding protein
MKKALIILTSLLLLGAMAGLTGQAMAASKLVVVTDTPPRTMDPHGSDADSNLSYMSNFFDGLLQRVGASGKLAPALAVKYERLDLLSWKFYLRKGVKFHNGNPFNAADVKYTFERMGNPKVSEFVNIGKNIDKIDVIDDYTVVIKTKTATPWFDQTLFIYFIMDKESTESRSQGEVGTKPIGTGAYKLKEWVKGSYVKLEANPDYWGGAPPIKEIESRPITESSTRFAALVSGQADLLWGVPVELYDKVAKNPKVEVVSRPARRCIFLALGNKPGTPFADIRVRKAVAMAINEDEIVAKVMRGQASKSAQIPDPPTTGYNPKIKRIEYNLAEAKKLMKAAGLEKGFDITLSGPTDRYVQDEQICEAVVKYLAKINIRAKLDVKPKSIFFPDVVAGKYPFYLIGWFDSSSDMGRTYSKLLHTYDKEKGYGGYNGTRFSDPEIDKVVEDNVSIVDLAKRKKVLQDLNRKAMEDKVAVIPLHYQVDVYAKQKGKGIKFIPRPDRWMVAKEISFTK